jgi:replicative DNA helicase
MSEQKQAVSGLFSKDAEQSVLGGLMLDNECWDEVLLLVSSDDFYYGVHRTIFREMARLINAGKPIDLITLSESIESQNKSGLEQFGGFAYLAELSKNTPSAANIVAYCEIVAKYSQARQLAKIGADITATVTKPGADIARVMEDAEQKITRLAERAEPQQAQTLIDGMTKLLTELERRFNIPDGITGAPTGFDEFDELTSGLQAGDLVLVAARPSMGKTAFLLCLLLNLLLKKGDSRGQFFSLEQPTAQILMRLVSSLGNVELTRLISGRLDDEDWARISQAYATFVELENRLVIDDTSGLTPTMLRMPWWGKQTVRRLSG